MKDFALLFSALFKQTFRFDKSKQKQNSKWRIYVIYGIVGVLCLPLLGGIAYLLYLIGTFAAMYDAQVGFLTCIFSIIQVVVLLFGIATVLNTIYFSKDNEMLLSYPLKPQTIFGVKLAFTYVIEFITNFVLSLFAIIPFAIGAGLPFSIGIILSFFILPMLPLLIATILTIPIMYLVSYFKNRSIMSTVALLVVTVVLFLLYFWVIQYLGMEGDEVADMEAIVSAMIGNINTVANVMLPNKFLALSMVGGAFGTAALNFLYAFLIDAGLFVIAYFVASFVYKRRVSTQLETPKSNSNKKQKYETGSKVWMFIKKDIKEIVRYPALAFYCLFEVILGPICLIVVGLNIGGFVGTEIEEIGMSFAEVMAQVPDLVAVVMISFITFVVLATNYTATTAFTRENKNFYILKILPMSYEKIAESKALLAFAVNEIGIVFMVVLSIFLIQIPLLSALFTLVMCSLISLLFCYTQVYLDMRSPRLNWDNISAGLKNNPASMLSILLALVTIGIVVGLYFLFSLAEIEIMRYIYFGVIALLAIGLFIYVRHVTIKNAALIIENINT